ncbi:MAG: glycosyltransferase [Candidatus Bathyarchaeota archaeon]|jgi:glycosyltransferase involved in cell wall biosynthesis
MKKKTPKKRRILMLSIHGDPATKIGSEEQGGQPIYIKDVCRLLSNHYEIDVFTRLKSGSEEERVNLFPDVNVVRIKAGPVEFVPKEKIYLYLNEFFMNTIRWIEKHDKKYSLVHSHYWYSGSVALKLKDHLEIPMVHNCHSLGRVKYDVLQEIKPDFADMRLLEEELILKRANAIIASTPQEVKNILDLYKLTGENIELIRTGVDKRLFRPIAEEIAIKETGLNFRNIVLFVGRITKAKGLRILVKAIARVKNKFNEEMKLVVIGGDVSGVMHSEEESKEKKRLRRVIRKRDLEEDVIFVGPVRRERLPYFYSIADVCVVPSLYESFGLVAVEAMSCGTPVIASKVGGLAHTVRDGYSGLHFLPGRADHLAKAILKLITDAEKMDEIGINARLRTAREFGLEKTVKQIKDLYDLLLF